jgi:hypothetical protein
MVDINNIELIIPQIAFFMGIVVIIFLINKVYNYMYCDQFDIINEHKNINIIDVSRSENGIPLTEVIVDII